MKTSILLSPAARRLVGHAVLAGALCWSGPSLLAQNAPPAPAGQAQAGTRALLTQDDLRELVGPIALYPDALIALILPASTVPSDVVLGARFVETKQDPNQSVGQPWDDSIKSLVYYPDVLSWMSENLEWTASLGEAFMDQPADVMNAIQGLRAQAKASGALTDTPQQKVVVQEEVIRIVPADPEVIYVPQYDPEVIFVDSYVPSYTPFLTFGIGFAVGSWLNYDCDWGRRSVYRGDWVGWNRGGWNRGGNVVVNNTDVNVVNTNVNVVNINGNTARRWEASPRSVRQIAQRQRDGRGNVRFTTPQARQAREMIRQERRQNNGKVAPKALAEARRNALPAPGRLEVREAAFNRVAKAGASRESSPAPARKAQSETSNRPSGTAARKAPSEAPRVTGQMEAARQSRRETANRPAPSQPTLRERATARRENAPSQVPTRAPQVREQNRASVAERQREAVQERRDNRPSNREPRPAPTREVRPAPQRPAPAQRQEARQERREVRPQRQEARQEQRSARPQRQEARPEPRASRPQAQQPKREARPQRQEARPQRQEARQERREERKEERKKKD